MVQTAVWGSTARGTVVQRFKKMGPKKWFKKNASNKWFKKNDQKLVKKRMVQKNGTK